MPNRLAIVRTIVAKDLRLFARDRFYAFVSALTLVAFAVVFWLLPADDDTSLTVGIRLPGGEELLAEAGDDEGLEVVAFDTSSELHDAVAAGELVAGLDFPPDFLDAVAAGRRSTVRVVLSADAPDALRPLLEGAAREVAFAIAGREPPVTLVDADQIVLGVDRGGPLPIREQLRPLLIVVVLLTEMFALASLVASEIAQRTAVAVVTTPARVGDLLAAKAVLGTGLAFGQVVVIAAVTGTIQRSPAIVLTTLLFGALLVTGVGLLAGATGGDFVAIVFWSVLFFVPLAIPAFTVLFPGTPSLWVRALPSYGLVESLVRAVAFDERWRDVGPYLALLAGWCGLVLTAGTAVLRRRMVRV